MNITIEKVDQENKDLVDLWIKMLEEGNTSSVIPQINVARGVFFLIKIDNEPVGIEIYRGIKSEFHECVLSYAKKDYRTLETYVVSVHRLVLAELKNLGVSRIRTIVPAISLEMIQNFKMLELEISAYHYEYDV